jgi:hypothetical protein
MRINEAGYVGIGTASPGAVRLNAAHNAGGEFAYKLVNTHATGYGGQLGGGSTSSQYALDVVNNALGSLLRVGSGGTVNINDTTTNANMTVGLTINQGDNINEALALKGAVSGFAHIMTDLAETDTYGTFGVTGDGGSGGLTIRSYSEGNKSFDIVSRQNNGGQVATDTTSSKAGVTVIAQVSTSNTVTVMPATGNIFAVTDGTNCRLIVKGNGTLHATNITGDQLDGVALDNEDDVGLLRIFERNLHNDVGVSMTKWDDQIKANEDDLKRVGVLSSESHFYNMQRMNSLLGGGIWQIHCRQQDLKEVVDYQQEEIESLKKELRLLKG